MKTIICLNCAACCKEKIVCLDDEDIFVIAKKYKFPFYRIRNTGIKIINWKETSNNQYVCIFLNSNNRCEIYDIRPKVCKDYHCSLTKL